MPEDSFKFEADQKPTKLLPQDDVHWNMGYLLKRCNLCHLKHVACKNVEFP